MYLEIKLKIFSCHLLCLIGQFPSVILIHTLIHADMGCTLMYAHTHAASISISFTPSSPPLSIFKLLSLPNWYTKITLKLVSHYPFLISSKWLLTFNVIVIMCMQKHCLHYNDVPCYLLFLESIPLPPSLRSTEGRRQYSYKVL